MLDATIFENKINLIFGKAIRPRFNGQTLEPCTLYFIFNNTKIVYEGADYVVWQVNGEIVYNSFPHKNCDLHSGYLSERVQQYAREGKAYANDISFADYETQEGYDIRSMAFTWTPKIETGCVNTGTINKLDKIEAVV